MHNQQSLVRTGEMDELSVETVAGEVIIPPLILEKSDFNGAAGEHGNSRMKLYPGVTK